MARDDSDNGGIFENLSKTESRWGDIYRLLCCDGVPPKHETTAIRGDHNIIVANGPMHLDQDQMGVVALWHTDPNDKTPSALAAKHHRKSPRFPTTGRPSASVSFCAAPLHVRPLVEQGKNKQVLRK